MSEAEAGRALRSGIASNTPQATRKRKHAPGEVTLRRLVAEARYAVDVDPYRGMMRYSSADGYGSGDSDAAVSEFNDTTTTMIPSPWELSCRWDAAANNNDEQENEALDTQAANLVSMVCQSRCPCLIRWTDQQMQKRKTAKKRKKGTAGEPRPAIGGRPTKDDERCRCDYNPFCLGTLGGAMDEVWQRRLQSILSSDENSDDMSSRHGSDKDVIDLQESGSEDSVPVVESSPTFSADPTLAERKTLYSHRTWTQLRTLRQSTLVETKSIRNYLSATLQSLTSLVSIDTCIERIEAWHGELLFDNPLILKPKTKEGHLRLALPPGIENLGATCYLNTQLQCLARITVFLGGIFSWRAPPASTEEDKVNQVLTLFQRIMANLHAGPLNTITTVEFSNALGIDHYEQQDPNEFSRLFFDLMHNAFQKEKSDKPGGLPELLPDLFQGMIKNQIICQKCKKMSERKEAFMDLNLPIVKKSEEDMQPQKTGQLSILECLAEQSETDVQFLFDRYCRDEILEGDNQYHCEVCGCKQDARRRVRFEKVPPLLNIQLSRYTYDMKTFAKKKVSEKVLLPTEMKVSSDTEGATTPHRYLLCAVMIHKGKSAYSGHYIAQAMDWTTGCWFEFNDTHVKLLKDGPDCSVDPNAEITVSKKGGSGSQDAYNLFYVEETFLAESIIDSVKNMEVEKESVPQAVDEKAVERISLHEDLRDSCLKDSKAADRLKYRRKGILDELFSEGRSLESLTDNMDPPPVWVPGDFLRRFFSCSDRFEDDLANDVVGDVIKASESLCVHSQQGISPRVACRGKLLPRIMYETIVASLQEERESLLEGQVEAAQSRQDGFVVSPSESMFCKECVKEFRDDMQLKVELLENYLFLFDELDPKTDDAPLQYEAGTPFACEEDKNVYLVSRKFCSSLRDHIKQIMKKVACVDAESVPVDENLLPKFESIAEGIETIQMQDLAIAEDSSVDKFVNSAVTCSHGSCTRFTKQVARFVSWKVWCTIQKLFPDAIQHAVVRRDSSDIEDVECFEECRQCASEGSIVSNLSTQISLVAKACRPVSGADADEVQLSEEDEFFSVVHRDDVKAIRRFYRDFSKYNSKSDPGEIRQEVLRVFQQVDAQKAVKEDRNDDFESLDEIDRRTLRLVTKMLRPIRCNRHKTPLAGILTTSSSDAKPHLSEDIVLLNQNSYRTYILSLCALARVLILSEEKLDVIDVMDDNSAVQDDDLKELCRKQDMYSWHPRLTYKLSSSDKAVIFALQDTSMSMLWRSHLCHDKECLSDFEKLYPPAPKQDETPKESRGNTADNAILIDVSQEESPASATTFPLTVFEADAAASVDSILKALTQYTAISTGQETETNGLGSFLRRSSRKRKSRISSGPLTSEETVQADMQNNVAALRLLLFESLREGTPFNPNHQLLLIVSPVDTRAEAETTFFEKAKNSAKVVSLDFALNEQSLFDLSHSALDGDISALVPKDSLIVVRQSSVDDTSLDIEKDSLMDYLINLSNAGSTSPASNGKKRKARVVERGFTGTLLSAGGSNQKKPKSDDGKSDENESSPKPSSSPRDDPSQCRALVAVDKNSSPAPVKEAIPLKIGKSPVASSPSPNSSDRVLIHDDDDDSVKNLFNVDDETNHDGVLLHKVLDCLKENPGVDSSKAKEMFRASEWACQENPTRNDVEGLAEIAFVKYIDLTLS